MSETDQALPVWPFPREDPLLPPPLFDDLRAQCPVTQVQMWDGSCAWLTTRHEDFKTVLRSQEVSAEASRPGYPNSSANHQASRGNQRSFIRMDDPDHAQQRRMLTKAFSVTRIATLRPFVEGLVDRLLDDMESRTPPVDLLQVVAEPLPSFAICEILGLPTADSHFLNDRVNAWMNLDSPPEVSQQATADLAAYLDALVTTRSSELGDDLVSDLIRDQLMTGQITREDFLSMLNLLIIGGFDTTANMIALGTVVLLRHPKQMDELRENPDLLPGAVEELLRFLSVAHHVASRVAITDVEVSGSTIPAGSGVIASIPAANHDPEAFQNPHAFDIHRDARAHVAFNFGVHQCLGQHLARLELQVVFGKLLARFPGLRLAVPEDQLNFRNSMIYGVSSLPVTW
jgi:cytochrome P450